MRVQKTSYMWKVYIWNPATCYCKTCKYLASIIDESVITCDEIIDAEARSYNEEKKHLQY